MPGPLLGFAGLGLTFASAAGAFDPEIPDTPAPPDPPNEAQAEEARRRTLLTSSGRGRADTLLTSLNELESTPRVQKATLLGS